MTFDGQTLIVLAAIAAASLYVARQVGASVFARKDSACGGCRNCAANQKPNDVFSIAPPASSEHTL